MHLLGGFLGLLLEHRPQRSGLVVGRAQSQLGSPQLSPGLGGLPLGWHFGGIFGLIAVASFSEFPVSFVYWFVLKRAGILRIIEEGRAMLLLAGGILVGLGIDRLWDMLGWR